MWFLQTHCPLLSWHRQGSISPRLVLSIWLGCARSYITGGHVPHSEMMNYVSYICFSMFLPPSEWRMEMPQVTLDTICQKWQKMVNEQLHKGMLLCSLIPALSCYKRKKSSCSLSHCFRGLLVGSFVYPN